MIINRCLNCAYLMTCDKTDRNKRDCEWFKAREIKIKDGRELRLRENRERHKENQV